VVVDVGRVVVDVEVVVVVEDVVVEVVVVVEDVVVEVVVEVVCETALVVNASSGTITQPLPSIFHASIKQVPPLFSYIHSSKGWLPASSSSEPDIIHVQPWSFQLPHSSKPILIVPPSSDASINSIV
jgi:hypothetical protein